MTLAENKYQEHCERYSDIHEHLPTLYKYAAECDHVTEMGVREVVSTWAFLHAKPSRLVSYDLFTSSNISLAKQAAKEIEVDFSKIPICLESSNSEDMITLKKISKKYYY